MPENSTPEGASSVARRRQSRPLGQSILAARRGRGVWRLSRTEVHELRTYLALLELLRLVHRRELRPQVVGQQRELGGEAGGLRQPEEQRPRINEPGERGPHGATLRAEGQTEAQQEAVVRQVQVGRGAHAGGAPDPSS